MLGSGVDGRYDHTKGWEKPLVYDRPWDTNQERMVTQALAAASVPGAELADMVRPPLKIDAFPPRLGYRTRALGIEDMIDIDEEYLPKFNDFSGGPAGYSGTSRNVQGSGSW
jgi:hypothetical protein